MVDFDRPINLDLMRKLDRAWEEFWEDAIIALHMKLIANHIYGGKNGTRKTSNS